jgi:hypothetical protein
MAASRGCMPVNTCFYIRVDAEVVLSIDLFTWLCCTTDRHAVVRNTGCIPGTTVKIAAWSGQGSPLTTCMLMHDAMMGCPGKRTVLHPWNNASWQA